MNYEYMNGSATFYSFMRVVFVDGNTLNDENP